MICVLFVGLVFVTGLTLRKTKAVSLRCPRKGPAKKPAGKTDLTHFLGES
jgi:hypothetical protein